ncbi:hypothetical protein CBR_g27869 [Chara braunii]|uniref:RNA-directed DNA polymerase n=1 Tax=Chara braunii TaxID=69332 RepID=A0A388L8Y2_CHABU|nr:hypothetical protein CBR_g27869 [Chara braunii]|eukprot:GBG78643.1 hypothetical protein CBR_g27869 [Chara braunii]
MPEEMVDGGRKLVTLDDLIDALDKRERAPSNVPKVDTFHFKGERVSDWLDLTGQALVGLSDEVKLQRVLRYVLHSHHQEVGKVVDAANGSWARFRDMMQRKYRLGDGLLTMADLEAMSKDDFSTIGAFVHEFKRKARKAEVQKRGVIVAQGRASGVVEEEARCEDYGGEETGSQILTKAQRKQRNLQVGGQGSGKGQVPQAIAAPPPAATTTSAMAGSSCMGPPPACGHWVPHCQPTSWPSCNHCASCGGSQTQPGQMVPYAGPAASMGPPSYPAAQGQFVAQPPPSQLASQVSVAGGGNQNKADKAMEAEVKGVEGVAAEAGEEMMGVVEVVGMVKGARTKVAGAARKGAKGHTVRFCERRREDELSGLISSCMDGDIYDKWGEHIDPRTPGGIRQEALRRAAAGPTAPPTMFRMWQEKEEPTVRVEEIVADSEEVTQRLKAGTIKEEPIVVESDDEGQKGEGEPAIVLLGRMEDLLEKVGRYQWKLQALCEEAREWEANLPEVFLYDSGPEPSPGQQGYPRVATVGTGPRSGMAYRPPTSHGRVPQAAWTRSQNKTGPSQEPSQAPSQAPPRKEPEPGRRKEVVEVPEEEEEDDNEEDERLRQEEDQRAKLRAKKRGAQEEAEPSLPDSVTKRKKYAVRMEEGFDVERMVDKLLEGHNDLMNLKDILASAPKLRGGFGDKEPESTGMVDTGAEMNIIREKEGVMIGMEIDRSDHGMLHGANCKAAFCGTASNMIIEIGKVRARTWFFVMPDVDHPILLGRLFLCRTEMLIFNKHDGTMILLLCDLACGNYEVITCRNTRPGSGRNRPNLGSFTFEESENERRRLWEVPEEEDKAKVLTLSLTDVNKAMEVVSAHDMADPKAIKALREQVLENPQVGEVELVYRLSGGGGGPAIAQARTTSPKEKEEDEVMPGVRRFVWKHVQDIDQVMGLLEEHNLTGSGPKSKHCLREAMILGFVCNESGRRPDVKKTDKILEWSVPFRSITDVRSFLGTCGFWRSFVKDFATKTEHLRKFVRQDQEWVWGEDQEEAVGRMKGEFKEGGLVLGAPNYEAMEDRPFVIETDAGPTALGGVLIQADTEGKERPLRFESRTLNTTERNYSQFKKETLAVLHCLRTFRNYVFGRRLILRVDPTALACSLKNYTPSDPTVARWLTYIWMFNFELERIPGNKNRADGLSRINVDGSDKESIEDTPLVDGFLDQEEDVRLHINEWSLRMPSCVSHPISLAPKGYEQKEELVLKPFQEEDPWGSKDVGWMMKLALAGTHSLVEEVRTIEEGPTQVEEHEQLMGGMYLLTNTLLQGDFNRKGSFSHEENEILVPESRDDEFEEGEIKEAFQAEEYDGIYRELGLLLSCEMRDRDASAKAQKMRHLYVEGNAEEFIPAYEQYMRDQGTGQEEWMQMLPLWTRRAERSLARQIRNRAHDWEDCQAQLRQAFRRLEPQRPEPRVERRQRSKRPRGPEARGTTTTRGGRKALAQREGPAEAAQAVEPVQAAELPPTYGLEQVEFRRITGSDLRAPSPTLPEGGEAVSLRTPLDRFEAHLDASQWGASQLGADQSGPARYEPVEDEPEEEPPEPGPKAGSREPEEPQTEGVITVGDDTPPPTPIPEQARQYWPEGIPEPDKPEEGERARTPTTVAPQLTEPTGARMDVEVLTPGEPPPGPPPAEEGTNERDPLREGHEARTGKPSGETKEEKRARVQVRLEELYQEKLRMEAAGEAPKPPIDPPMSEQRISKAWASYESERDAARLRSQEVGQGSARLDEARETEDLGFSTARMEIERADRRIGEVVVSSFQLYSMLRDELAASRLEVGQLSTQLAEERAENQAWRSHMEVKEAEWEKRFQDMAAMVERLSATKVVDWTEQSRYGIQGEEVQGLFGREGTTEPPQQGGMGKVFLDPIEAAARREAEEGRFIFRTPTELASRQATPMTVEIPEGEPAQGPQPPVEEGGPTEESPTILLEAQEGALTGAAASTEPEAMGGEASRLDELVAAMELDMPSREPQRQKTPERVPEIGELRTQLGSLATGADSGEHI